MFSPSSALAATGLTFGSVITNVISTILKPLVVLIVGWAVIVFIWSLIQYLQGDAPKKKDAKARIGWGILVLFVMVSLWGLVNILKNTFFGMNGASNTAPTYNQLPLFKTGSTGSNDSGGGSQSGLGGLGGIIDRFLP